MSVQEAACFCCTKHREDTSIIHGRCAGRIKRLRVSVLSAGCLFEEVLDIVLFYVA